MSLCVTRLRKEYKELQKNPVQNIIALPKETNILEWHYVIIGQEDSPYKGGYFHGTVVFPSDYPFKPPTIRMMTPSGRFKPGARLCLSMSDFHPESWNPMWSVGTILLGLYSFMLEDRPTNGSVESTIEEKRMLALKSLEHNTTNKVYCELFPDLVQLYQDLKADSSNMSPVAAEKADPQQDSGELETIKAEVTQPQPKDSKIASLETVPQQQTDDILETNSLLNPPVDVATAALTASFATAAVLHAPSPSIATSTLSDVPPIPPAGEVATLPPTIPTTATITTATTTVDSCHTGSDDQQLK